MKHCRRSSGVIYNNTGFYNGPRHFGEDWSCVEAEVYHRIHDDDREPEPAPRPGVRCG
jgi:hypothetical protein